MIEGESGLKAIFPPWQPVVFESSKRRVTFHTGATATIFSGHEPDQLRGPQHDTAWCDELASWQYPQETWDNLQFGMRLGDPKICITTTPKPMHLLRSLLANPKVAKTVGSTYENLANLAGAYDDIIAQYEGTSLGQQELHAALLDEMPGALLTRAILNACHLPAEQMPQLRKIVVAIDPAVTATEQSSETGIIVAGMADNGHGYVLEDQSGRLSPEAWARRAVEAYHRHHANLIIGEQNNGGDMVRHTIFTVDPAVAYHAVTASRGKYTRAEPIASLYQQGKIHHIGAFPALEDQWATWQPGETSPDRLDADVWALSYLFPPRSSTPLVGPVAVEAPRGSKWAGAGGGSWP